MRQRRDAAAPVDEASEREAPPPPPSDDQMAEIIEVGIRSMRHIPTTSSRTFVARRLDSPRRPTRSSRTCSRCSSSPSRRNGMPFSKFPKPDSQSSTASRRRSLASCQCAMINAAGSRPVSLTSPFLLDPAELSIRILPSASSTSTPQITTSARCACSTRSCRRRRRPRSPSSPPRRTCSSTPRSGPRPSQHGTRSCTRRQKRLPPTRRSRPSARGASSTRANSRSRTRR